ncbi:hypothetical protein GGR51DRAFT_497274 [Nemania sp. FL0031]|nr:hypothetical protein GGR51DRAFT_497274 [Nemania sp. FL0031]
MAPAPHRNPLRPNAAGRRSQRAQSRQPSPAFRQPSPAFRQPVGLNSHSQHGGPERTPGSGTKLDPFILSPTDDSPLTRDPFDGMISPPITPQRSPPQARPSYSSSKSAPALLQPNPPGDADSPLHGKRRKADRSPLLGVDKEIIEKIKEPLTAGRLRKTDELGHVYLFEVTLASEPQKTIFKIGKAKNTEVRRSRISKDCSHLSIKEEEDPEDRPIVLPYRAESLAQAQLCNRVYEFACACGTTHREYFDVDKAAALGVIRCWRVFCEREPYSARGELLPFWERRLQHYEKTRNEWYNDDSCQTLTEAERLEIRWKRFSSVSRLQILFFDIAHDSANVWPVVALVEALAFASLTSLPLFIAIMAVVIMVSIMIWKNEWKFPGLSAWVMDWASWF